MFLTNTPYTVDQSLGKLYKILARILNEMSVCVLNGVQKNVSLIKNYKTPAVLFFYITYIKGKLVMQVKSYHSQKELSDICNPIYFQQKFLFI